MEIFELWGLAEFKDKYLTPIHKSMSEFGSALQHNASQQNKIPLTESFESVVARTARTPLEELTYSQREWLSDLDIFELLGPIGVQSLKAIKTDSSFDPATAATDIQKNIQRLAEAIQKLTSVQTALEAFPWVVEHPLQSRDQIEIRVNFKSDAGIKNPSDLRKSSQEWYEIIRGVANAVDQKPEDVSIKGVSNGSIILWLVATVGVTALLAKIIKNVSNMALDGLKVATAIESLKQQKLHTDAIEQNLLADRAARLASQQVDLQNEIKLALPDLSPEKESWLNKSVENILKFFEAGGDVDFIEPQDSMNDGDLEDDEEGEPEDLVDLRENLVGLRNTRKEVLFLTNRADNID